MFDKIQMTIMMKTSISNIRISRLNYNFNNCTHFVKEGIYFKVKTVQDTNNKSFLKCWSNSFLSIWVLGILTLENFKNREILLRKSIKAMKPCVLLSSVQEFIEIGAWLLLTFFIWLHNQLSSIHFIVTF